MLFAKAIARLILFKMLRPAAILIASAAAFTPPRSLPHTRTAMKFSAAEAELVPRDVLFGNPEYSAGVGINVSVTVTCRRRDAVHTQVRSPLRHARRLQISLPEARRRRAERVGAQRGGRRR